MKKNEVIVISGEIKDGIYSPMKGVRMIKVFDYLKDLPRSFLPKSGIHKGEASNSEIYRWLKQRSIIVNGERPQPDDLIELPIKELVFFDKGKRRTTLVK